MIPRHKDFTGAKGRTKSTGVGGGGTESTGVGGGSDLIDGGGGTESTGVGEGLSAQALLAHFRQP